MTRYEQQYRTAVRRLIEEVEFLGLENIGELVEDIRKNPLAYPSSTINAYMTYIDRAYS